MSELTHVRVIDQNGDLFNIEYDSMHVELLTMGDYAVIRGDDCSYSYILGVWVDHGEARRCRDMLVSAMPGDEVRLTRCSRVS